MPVSDAQKRATAKYRREHSRVKSVRFYESEYDLLDWLAAQPKGYLKRLIREDMERSGTRKN